MGADWDERYRKSGGQAAPADLLTAFAGLLPNGGRALDLACGSGRNTLWLAGRGFDVVGIDLSAEALRQGRELSSRNGLRVNWVQADVETAPLTPGEFDVILSFYFRSPALYPRIRAALRPGGWLFYETYTLEQLRHDSGPRNPDHLLRPGELLRVFADWRVVFYRETATERGIASLVAQKPMTGEK